MQNIKIALRSFFRKGNGNIIKILSLGTGLAIGIVLIAKVCFEVSYDSGYANGDRIYKIFTGASRQSGEETEYGSIPGAIAPGIKDYVPGVVEATRYTGLFGSDKFYTEEKKQYKAYSLLMDSCFFKVFDRPILAGDPAKVLGRPFYCMVSKSLADKIGGDVIGKVLFNEERPDLPFTIDGIYEDFPLNGSFSNLDIIISIETYPASSRNNWLGNDRYRGYVVLAPGITTESVAPGIRKMQEDHQNIQKIEEKGNNLWFFLKPFETLYTSDPDVRNMNILLSLIAFALIFTAVMNYILIVISSLVRRTKEVGVRKCYGAEGHNIRKIMMAETTMHLLCSLVIAAVFILAFRGMIETLVGATLTALFTPATIGILIGVCLLVYLISGLIPSYLFMKIPVSTVFRNYRESKRRWKLALLFFQFIATAFMVTFLLIIGMQYEKMANDKTGYYYENLVYFNFTGATKNQVLQTMDKLKTLSFVEQVEACDDLPIWGSSGNNIELPGNPTELFNVADQYGATPGFFDMMQFKLIEGHRPESPKDVAVSRNFIELMKPFADWSDGAVGKEIYVSEHSQGKNDLFTICGVYEDYRVGSLTNLDVRATIRFCDDFKTYDPEGQKLWYMKYIVLKVSGFESFTIPEIAKTVKEALPEKDIDIFTFKESIRDLYAPSKKFRDSVMIGGIITLIIALIGLIGYINDETNRRSSEIAIRKINGAVVPEILKLFTIDILKISLPAIILGNLATYFVSVKWMEQFSEKITLQWWLFALCAIIVLIIIVTVVIIDCLKIANSNPIESLKNE